MGNKDVFLANAILTQYLITASAYLALLKEDNTEVSGGSYARRLITVSAPASGKTQNTLAITFPVATANWGTVAKWAVKSALTSGNTLWSGSFPLAKAVNTNDTAFTVGIGGLVVEEV